LESHGSREFIHWIVKENGMATGNREKASIAKWLVTVGILPMAWMIPYPLQAACGPGSHWVDNCATGSDTLNLTATIGVDLDLNGSTDTTLEATGPGTILRGVAAPSDARNPNHNDRIPAEVVSISLSGGGLTILAGDGVGNLASDGPEYSSASIIETAGDPALAGIVLDIFVRLTTSLGISVHNQTPIHVESTINRFPVSFSAVVNGPIPLLSNSGVRVLDITSIRFSVTALTSPTLPPNSLVSGASFRPATQPNGAVAPGSIVAVFGANLNDGSTTLSSSFGADGRLVTTLGGSQVLINGTPVPLFYSTHGQLAIQMPTDLTGSSATVQIKVGNQTSETQTVVVAPLSPGIFTLNQQGTGQGAILIANTAILVAPAGSVPGRESRPARRGDFISIFCTGLGDVTNRPPTGAPPASGVISETIAPTTVTIGGVTVPASFSGLTAFVGLSQVNVQIPEGAPTGDAVEIVIHVGNQNSNPATTAIQ
jgi:uncharacterized protein (TIGR03437 family)